MQTITREYKVYPYAELSADAKKSAIENNFYINVEDWDWWEFIKEDQLQKLEQDLGISAVSGDVYFSLDRDRYLYIDKPFFKDVGKFLKYAGYDLRTKKAKGLAEDLYISTDHRASFNYIDSQGEWGTCEDLDKLNNVLNQYLEGFIKALEYEYEYQTSEGAIVAYFEDNNQLFLGNGAIFS